MNTDLLLEDLPYCPADKAVGGISTRIWYAPVEYFGKINIPAVGSFEDRIILNQKDISLYGGKKLKYIDAFIDQNALSQKPINGPRKWKMTSELSISVLELNARNLGFVDAIKNTALVLFIVDANGRIWVLGNKINPAYLSSFEGNSGKKYEDDSLMNLNFTANTKLYQYGADLSAIRAIGGFTAGFTIGFRI